MSDDRRLEAVLEGLDSQQRAAVEAEPGPVCILAGAGTGKTRTITRRMAHLALTGQVAPRAILAVTHSTQAAGELRDRIRLLGVAVQARTFHSAASRQLRHFWSRTGLPGDRLILVENSEQNHLLRGALSAVSGSVATTDVMDLRSEIQWAKRRRLAPGEYPAAARAAGRTRALPADALAGAFARYEKAKRHVAKLDFDDMIEQCSILLENDGEVVDQVRAWYQCFVVDEYQDIDPAQERLLATWLGTRDNVTVVGDPSQTIYSFKGADPSLLAGFAAKHPGAVSISLKKDYRSTPQIVAAANRLMAHSSARVVLEGQRPDGPEPVRVQYDSETDELDGVVERVGELLADGVPAAEIAVLLRTNSQVSSFRSVLAEAGVPTEVFDDDKYFERPEIRKVIRALEENAARGPAEAGLAVLLSVLGRLGFDPDAPPPGFGASRNQWDTVMALLRLVRRLPEEAGKTASALVEELRRRAEAEHAPILESGVTLATMHKSKGLEWDVVLVPELTEGLLPISYAKTPEAVAEERRLLYVAVTRARQRLELSYASHSDKGRPKEPSRFLSTVVSSGNFGSVPDKPATRFTVGDRVMASAFGIGRVKAVGKIEATVDFGGSFGVKKVRLGSLSAL